MPSFEDDNDRTGKAYWLDQPRNVDRLVRIINPIDQGSDSQIAEFLGFIMIIQYVFHVIYKIKIKISIIIIVSKDRLQIFSYVVYSRFVYTGFIFSKIIPQH